MGPLYSGFTHPSLEAERLGSVGFAAHEFTVDIVPLGLELAILVVKFAKPVNLAAHELSFTLELAVAMPSRPDAFFSPLLVLALLDLLPLLYPDAEGSFFESVSVLTFSL